ncbi:MAG: hypothetical protein OXE94_03725 [Aestuariivita sp.]|nr:hypothetical protein [Aestuariivita sp.]
MTAWHRDKRIARTIIFGKRLDGPDLLSAGGGLYASVIRATGRQETRSSPQSGHGVGVLGPKMRPENRRITDLLIGLPVD